MRRKINGIRARVRKAKLLAKERNNKGRGMLTAFDLAMIRAVQIAGRNAARKAMITMGYVVEARENWIVKRFIDGRVIKISEIK